MGVTLRTYRRYEAGSPQRGSGPIVAFAGKYDVSLDWLVGGETASIGSHLAKQSQGVVAILPAKGKWYRQSQATIRKLVEGGASARSIAPPTWSRRRHGSGRSMATIEVRNR